jgi:cytoskeletal protein CcmA (bactofilin family)
MIHNQEFTYIGKNNILKGEFEFTDQTHIAGTIDGLINMTKSHKLILEIGSHTKAIMNCYDLDVYGTIIGEIHSQGLVTFYPSANFEGKIYSKKLEIFPGAVVNMQGQTSN